MILLRRGEEGTAIITASEKAVVLPTVYNISFTHDLTKKVVLFANAVDTSPSPERYNRFMLDISSFEDLDNGFFSYEVTDQDGNILETGKAKLEGDKPEIKQYQDTPTQYETYGQ
jgi:hypothetical protein